MTKAHWSYKSVHCWAQATACGAFWTLWRIQPGVWFFFFLGSRSSETELGDVRGRLSELGSPLLVFPLIFLTGAYMYTDLYRYTCKCTMFNRLSTKADLLLLKQWPPLLQILQLVLLSGLCNLVSEIKCNMTPRKVHWLSRWCLSHTDPAGGKSVMGLAILLFREQSCPDRTRMASVWWWSSHQQVLGTMAVALCY